MGQHTRLRRTITCSALRMAAPSQTQQTLRLRRAQRRSAADGVLEPIFLLRPSGSSESRCIGESRVWPPGYRKHVTRKWCHGLDGRNTNESSYCEVQTKTLDIAASGRPLLPAVPKSIDSKHLRSLILTRDRHSHWYCSACFGGKCVTQIHAALVGPAMGTETGGNGGGEPVV